MGQLALPSLAFIAVVFATAPSFAQSVKIKKAVREGDEAVAAAAATLKEKCGVAIQVTSKHMDAGKIKEDGRDEANMISVAGSLCAEVVTTLAEVCADEDYKAEIAKLKTLQCVPKKMEKRPFWIAKLNGTNLVVEHSPTTSNYSDGREELKAAF